MLPHIWSFLCIYSKCVHTLIRSFFPIPCVASTGSSCFSKTSIPIFRTEEEFPEKRASSIAHQAFDATRSLRCSLLLHRASLADHLIRVVDDSITDKLDPDVFCIIASYCDLGSFQRHVPREELSRRVNGFVREQRRLRETFVNAIENGCVFDMAVFGRMGGAFASECTGM